MLFSSLLLILCHCAPLYAQQKLNGNFEQLDSNGNPTGWDLTYNKLNKYETKLDSLIKKQGKYSVSISSGNLPLQSSAIIYKLDHKYSGKNLILVGNIKTENVSDGSAGMWIRVVGGKDELAFETMDKQQLNGTNDWKEYMITVPYDEINATGIHFGAMLNAKGKMWIDSIRLYLDEVPIDRATVLDYAALKDTLLNQSSGIDKYLALLGQTWGFLKYHHPAIAKGAFNWDAALFRIIPSVLKATNDKEFSTLLENWIDNLGKVPNCDNCKLEIKASEIILKPSYGTLFTNKTLSSSLVAKLKFILNNTSNRKNYYVSLAGADNPSFDHELIYSNNNYPDAGLRLLALFRYWNIIQYYCPNREIIPSDWNKVLYDFIPELTKASNKLNYANTLAKLVSTIHDGHAFIDSKVYDQSLGKYRLPIGTKYIDDQLVVNNFFSDTLNIKSNLKLGDVLIGINGVKVSNLITQYLPFIPSSNFESSMRDLPGTYLLRSNEQQFKLEILRDGQLMQIVQNALINNEIDTYLWGPKPHLKPYQLLNKDIGYVLCNMFKATDMDSIKKQFASTKGMIVDMRNYPLDEMVHSLGKYFKSYSSPFIRMTYGSISHPGNFIKFPVIKNGETGKESYQGKIVILVNELTQSNAEFVTMAFQSAKNVKVIGSTTAGADGNISIIKLPGGFNTWISGLGVYYPDGTNAQQKGVKIDFIIKPTLTGIKNGVDEVLEKAKSLIVTNTLK